MARKIKIHQHVEHNDNVSVRLAAQNLLRAVDAAKRGDVDDMSTFIRLAHMFEQDIPAETRFRKTI